MGKSLRNALVSLAYEALVNAVSEAGIECDPDGVNWNHSFDSSDTIREIHVIGRKPVVVLWASMRYDDEVYGIIGYSNLKGGDKWDSATACEICCKRAARNFADLAIEDVAKNMIDDLFADVSLYGDETLSWVPSDDGLMVKLVGGID